MRGLVKFWDERPKIQTWSRVEVLGPVEHSIEDVDKPLTNYVIAYCELIVAPLT